MTEKDSKCVKYKLVPPEGGWGYMVSAGMTVMMLSTVIPMVGFGLIFNGFLTDLGDQTSGTTLANGFFNTLFSFTGLFANFLLQKYSYRFVGYLGSILFFIGAFATIFVNSTVYLVISFGIIQGLGFGLLCPATYTAFNYYFDKRMTVVMSICQAFMVAGNMVFPYVAKFLMDNFGFRGTLLLIAGISLNCFPSIEVLQPVEWHMKKVPCTEDDEKIDKDLESKPKYIEANQKENDKEPNSANANKKLALDDEECKVELDPLMEDKKRQRYQHLIMPEPRNSVVSLGERAVSVSAINYLGADEKQSTWKSMVDSLNLDLFKDPVYINITCGLSLSFTGDVAFIPLMPMILQNVGFTSADSALIMTVFFASDFVSRLLLTVLVIFVPVTNRMLFLIGSLGTVVFRIGFILSNEYWWKVLMCVCLGSLRSLIQTPLPLVISERYSDKFASAFSLYMVICGVVCLIFGPLMSVIKSSTGSDVLVLHVLTLAYLTTVITWVIEIIYTKINRKSSKI